MKDLSAKQQRIFEFIRDFIDRHDYPPSIRQIQEACEISSTSVVDYNLRILEGKGFIRGGYGHVNMAPEQGAGPLRLAVHRDPMVRLDPNGPPQPGPISTSSSPGSRRISPTFPRRRPS